MNTEIKYRAKAMSGEWVYGNFIHSKRFEACSNEYRIHNQDTGLESDILIDTLCQLVAVINGVEFYENDICTGVKCHSDKKFVIRRRVDNEFVGFVPVELHKKGLSMFVRWDDLKIIGNAIDSPDLLEGVSLNSL
jgi:hypothetical protein